MANSNENFTDTVLLYNTFSFDEYRSHNIESLSQAFKEDRLSDREKLRFARILLQSPYIVDCNSSKKIFQELIQNQNQDDSDDIVLEYYIGLIICYFRNEEYDNALLFIDEARRNLPLFAEEAQRINNLENIIKNRKRFSGGGWKWAGGALAVGALVAMALAKR